MKEDILEQLVDDYLKLDGYFTIHNVRFIPSALHPDFVVKQDAVASDIDVIGYHPRRTGPERVKVVTCKSWQGGFPTEWWSRNVSSKTIFAGREAWRFFRELVKPKWTQAFLQMIEDTTGERQFTYVTAVTWFKGRKELWENRTETKSALNGNPVQLLAVKEILTFIESKLTETPASSEVGRLLQVLKASKKA